MKIRKSSSLLAAGCTLCVAAASGVVAPQAAAAAPPVVRVVSRDVALTASFDPFVIASLPLQNLIATIGAFQAVGAAGITPLNTAFAAFAKGDVAGIGTAPNGYVGNEVTAIANVLNLPIQLIETDLAAIGLLQNAFSSVETLAKTSDAASISSAVDPVAGLLGLASLPLQDLLAVISAGQAFGAAAITPLNTAFAAFAKGDIAGVSAALDNYFQKELTAFNNLLSLPVALVESNLAYITEIFGAAQAAALTTTPFTAPAAELTAAAADPVSGFVTLASLPLQNTLTTISAFQAVGAAAITPLNSAFLAFSKGDIAGINTALHNYFVNELTAINNLLGLPASIIAQDIAVVTGAFGGGASLQSIGVEASGFSANADASDEQASGGEELSSGGDNSEPSTLAHHEQSRVHLADEQQNLDAGGDGEQDVPGDDDAANDAGNDGATDKVGDDAQGQPDPDKPDVNNGDDTKGGDNTGGDNKADESGPKANADKG